MLKSVHHSRTLTHKPLDWQLIRTCPTPLLLVSNKKGKRTGNVVAALDTGSLDWITVTSSAIANSLVAMFGDSLRQARLASISPITTCMS